MKGKNCLPWIVFMLMAILFVGCASTPTEPIIKYETKVVNAYVGLRVTAPECPPLPQLPAFPEGGTAEEKKEWAFKVGEIRDKREEMYEGCIDGWEIVVGAINDHADYVDEGWVPNE